MKKILFEDATLTSQAKVTIDGVDHLVTEAEYNGGTDLNANTFNELQNNVEDAINEINTPINLIPNGAEVRINEKRDGKWVYAKQFLFTDVISTNTRFYKAHQITNFDKIWLDLSECYMTSTTGIIYPMDMIGYNGAFNSQMFCYLDNTNINIFSNDSWGTNWTKVITIKYTKTTD